MWKADMMKNKGGAPITFLYWMMLLVSHTRLSGGHTSRTFCQKVENTQKIIQNQKNKNMSIRRMKKRYKSTFLKCPIVGCYDAVFVRVDIDEKNNVSKFEIIILADGKRSKMRVSKRALKRMIR